MPGARSYDDPCGVARALNLIEGRWALLVVRELLLGPKRYSELVAGLPTVSQNVLAQRLRDLEDADVVGRRGLGPPAGAWVYELTPRGRELEPVLLELARWGSQAPLPQGDLSPDALALALRTTFSPDRAADLSARVALRLGRDRLLLEVAAGAFAVRRPAPDDGTRASALVTGDTAAVRDLVFAGRPVDELVRAGRLAVDGDIALVQQLACCFPRPAR